MLIYVTAVAWDIWEVFLVSSFVSLNLPPHWAQQGFVAHVKTRIANENIPFHNALLCPTEIFVLFTAMCEGWLLGVCWFVCVDSLDARACWTRTSPEWTFGSGWCRQGRPERQHCINLQLLHYLSVCLSQWQLPEWHENMHVYNLACIFN